MLFALGVVFILILNFSPFSCYSNKKVGSASRYDPSVGIDYCGPWVAINVTTLPLARAGLFFHCS